jgi:sugar O-acyltransferase (sialic acid O-acetyltransferase NeuD family)
MDKLIIWGATGQAIVLEELLSYTPIKIDAFFDNDINCFSPIEGISIYYGKVGFEQWKLTATKKTEYGFLVAIGGNHGIARAEIGSFLKQSGLKPYTAIHSTAFVAKNCIIGEGVQILANSSVCAKVQIGKYCIINTAASIDHECVIGDNVHIGPGAKLAGCVTIGNNVFIGINATILPRVYVGENAIIGAGAVVLKDVPSNATVVGNPARLF